VLIGEGTSPQPGNPQPMLQSDLDKYHLNNLILGEEGFTVKPTEIPLQY
jgi:hypothetical protein